MAHKPEELQEVLHYTFKNPALLRIALTHTSYANESKVATTHNERLEFLGDSVLSVVVADYLFHQSGRPEGELTRMRASLVSEDALFQFAQEIQLGEYLRLGHGEDLGGGRSRPSVVSDARPRAILSCPSSPRARLPRTTTRPVCRRSSSRTRPPC